MRSLISAATLDGETRLVPDMGNLRIDETLHLDLQGTDLVEEFPRGMGANISATAKLHL